MDHQEEVQQDITHCPACGSDRIVRANTRDPEQYDLCLGCKRAWERLPAGEPYLRDGEMMPWKKPCDNCAWRGNSPERKDPERWALLQESIAYQNGSFYCHKGVPFKLNGTEVAFEYPKTTTPQRKVLADFDVTLPEGLSYDVEKMRLCRGYLNAHVIPEMRKAKC